MIDHTLTAKLAKLCAIELSEDELLSVADDMTDIISVMDKVKTFSTDIDISTHKQIDFKALRDDTPIEIASDITHDTENSYFVVPPLIQEV